MSVPRCPHGYFTRGPSNHCPRCFGVDDSNRKAIPVVGHGNGWLLFADDPICTSCGGPATAGWGMVTNDRPLNQSPPSLCYVCRIGDNTKEAIARRATHETARGKKKNRGGRSAP